MRVRGLKQVAFNVSKSSVWSHPMRVRGLKLPLRGISVPFGKSHPMRVRGLKQIRNNQPRRRL